MDLQLESFSPAFRKHASFKNAQQLRQTKAMFTLVPDSKTKRRVAGITSFENEARPQ